MADVEVEGKGGEDSLWYLGDFHETEFDFDLAQTAEFDQ